MSWGEKKNKKEIYKKTPQNQKKTTKNNQTKKSPQKRQKESGLTPTQPLQRPGLASALLQDRDEWNNSLSREPYQHISQWYHWTADAL